LDDGRPPHDVFVSPERSALFMTSEELVQQRNQHGHGFPADLAGYARSFMSFLHWPLVGSQPERIKRLGYSFASAVSGAMR
jgi:hypothetical protein